MTNHLEETFGFKIFMLREVKETEDHLLYNIETKKYNQYSKKRLITVLLQEFKLKQINLNVYLEKLGLDLSKVKKDKLICFWIDEELALIDNLNYKPSDELIFNDDNKLFFNIYNKSKLLIKKDFEVGEFKYIKQLIMNLVGDNEIEYDYFLKWLAWQIQNPLVRLPTSIIFQGEQGTGKSQFCNKVLKNIFGNNFTEIGQTDINSDWNDYIMGKQLIVANEVIHNDNKFLVPDKLKNYVTDEYIRILRRFRDGIITRNYAQWIFVTNNDIPLKIDKDDRRYSVFKSKKLVNGYELIKNLDENLVEEIKYFMNYLLSLELNFDEVSQPLHNSAKDDLIKANYNSVEEFIELANETGGFDKLNSHYYKNDYLINLETHQLGESLCFVTDNLYKLYVRFCLDYGITYKFNRNNFSRQMKKYGFETTTARIDDKVQRVLKVIKVNK